MSTSPGRPGAPIAVRAAAVLTPAFTDLEGFTEALFTGTAPAGQFDDVLDHPASRCLDAEDARKARRVAARSALPAQTAAVVALRTRRGLVRR